MLKKLIKPNFLLKSIRRNFAVEVVEQKDQQITQQ